MARRLELDELVEHFTLLPDEELRGQMRAELEGLDAAVPTLPWLVIADRGKAGAIKLTDFEAAPEPKNQRRLKAEIRTRWGTVPPIDMLKEAVLRTGCLTAAAAGAGRGDMPPEVLAERLILAIYAYGTNTEIRAVTGGGWHEHSEDDLRYVRRRYLNPELAICGTRGAALPIPLFLTVRVGPRAAHRSAGGSFRWSRRIAFDRRLNAICREISKDFTLMPQVSQEYHPNTHTPGSIPDVLWIGGGCGAGKSTVARSLAHRLDLRLYPVDAYTFDHQARAADLPATRALTKATFAQRWLEPSSDEQVERFVAHATERFALILEDLARIPASPGVVVEGPQLLPDLLGARLASPKHAVWLLPTEEFTRRAPHREVCRRPGCRRGWTSAEAAVPHRAGLPTHRPAPTGTRHGRSQPHRRRRVPFPRGDGSGGARAVRWAAPRLPSSCPSRRTRHCGRPGGPPPVPPGYPPRPTATPRSPRRCAT